MYYTGGAWESSVHTLQTIITVPYGYMHAVDDKEPYLMIVLPPATRFDVIQFFTLLVSPSTYLLQLL